MTRVKRLWILLAALVVPLLLVIGIAKAAGTTANVAWTMPTSYNDNEVLPLTDIANVTLTWAPASGQAGPSGTLVVNAPATTATVPVACGSVTFTATVTTTSTAKYPNATSSPSSGVPYITGITCKPNPATGLTAS
jgi:hypothetical protein